jgi:hypothetical protein
MDAVLALHALATIMMTGLIWFVQLVHYPGFNLVGRAVFAQYVREHGRRVTWIVAPTMAMEGLTAFALVYLAEGNAMRVASVVGVALVVVIWASTAFLQVPCHRKLATGFDEAVARRLVATNWLRTVVWTARALLAVAMPLMAQTS